MKAGHKAKYVLMDSWFANPRQIVDIRPLGCHVIAMVKRSSKIRYCFEGQMKNIREIYASCRKRRGRSKYLLSLPVQICAADESPMDARIVCVRSRNNRVFFKVCKSALLLTKGYHGLSYDALTAHISIVFARYMLLAVAKRGNEDERTLGELFYLMVSEVADLSFRESMLLIVSAMIDAVEDMFRLTDTQVNGLLERFLGNLPEHLRRSLQPYLAA